MLDRKKGLPDPHDEWEVEDFADFTMGTGEYANLNNPNTVDDSLQKKTTPDSSGDQNILEGVTLVGDDEQW